MGRIFVSAWGDPAPREALSRGRGRSIAHCIPRQKVMQMLGCPVGGKRRESRPLKTSRKLPRIPLVPIRHREEFMTSRYLPIHRRFSTPILGPYDSERKLVYAGFCDSGLSEETRVVILEELKATRRKTLPVPRGTSPPRRFPGVPRRFAAAGATQPRGRSRIPEPHGPNGGRVRTFVRETSIRSSL